MTAEIAIMNNLGVAMASDSAVTLSGGQGKVYASADKVFQLSRAAPVGAMVYGGGCVVGIPWETVIKTYRKELGRAEFDTVEGYVQDFIRWLAERPEIFSPSVEDRESEALVAAVFGQIMDDIWRKVNSRYKDADAIDPQAFAKIVHDTIQANRDEIMRCPEVQGLPKGVKPALRRKFRNTFPKLSKTVLEKIPLTPALLRQLNTMAIEALVRCVGLVESGIVVAGFGATQYEPQLVDVGIYGMIRGQPKYAIKSASKIDPNTRSIVRPFAQGEMVYAFMEGIDPRVEAMMRKSTEVFFSGVMDTLIEAISKQNKKLGGKLANDVTPVVEEMLDRLFTEWQTARREWHWGQITGIVASLPKDELGAMAESLVNLTKFRRRVSTEKETVGGPIDVAVITKGDGFVWVRRKHYFESDLNPRIMARYFNEVAEYGKAD